MATILAKIIDEKETAVFSGTLKASSTAVIPVANLASATLTLYNEANSAIINSRDAQNVLNLANVAITSGGILTWDLQALDNIIVDTALGIGEIERHIALFQFTTVGTSPIETFRDELVIQVRSLNKVS
jgi:hypothetical protein